MAVSHYYLIGFLFRFVILSNQKCATVSHSNSIAKNAIQRINEEIIFKTSTYKPFKIALSCSEVKRSASVEVNMAYVLTSRQHNCPLHDNIA